MNSNWINGNSPVQNSSEINLIDLLDNIHINNDNTKEKQIEDYRIRMLEEFCSTSKVNKHSNIDDEEFALFFDKYEKNKQETEISNADLNAFMNNTNTKELSAHTFKNDRIKNSNSDFKFDNTLKMAGTTPRVLIPKLELKQENINEDLIEEVLFEQQLEKQIYKTEVTKRYLTPEMKKAKDGELNDSILNEIVNKNVNYFIKPTQTIADKVSETCRETEKTKIHQKALTQELVTKNDIKYLETVKKNNKLIRSSILKSEAEKMNFTAGPSLYEKSVVLPQIMQRLRERQKVLEERSKLTMRLILDGGAKKTNVKPLDADLSDPQVLMADCNKERLRAHKSAKLFNSFVRFGSFEK